MVRKVIPITLSQAIDGFMLEKKAEQRSLHTLADYANAFRHFTAALQGDPMLDSITADQVRTFLRDLGDRPVTPAGVAPRPAKVLGKKSILNIHTALSSLWSWAEREGYASEHVLREVTRPRPERRAIVPYSREDVQKMLAACEAARSYRRKGQRVDGQARPTALRDQAILLVLLDTGMRASELCALRIRDVDQANQRCVVFGKGAKERILKFGRRTAREVWRYLATRPDAGSEEPLFLSGDGQHMTREALYQLVEYLGERAGVVPAANVHRFRHTFAISFLRNGGDAYSLQMSLGHTEMEMVRTYLAIVQADVEGAHKRASPVDNWRL